MFEFIKTNAAACATVFFFLFFCSVVYSVFKKGQRKKFEDYSKIPMNDEFIENGKKSAKKSLLAKSKSKSARK